MKFKNVQEIASWRLCIGCGACTYACPENRVKLYDIIDEGIRPIIEKKTCGSCDECIKVCPGVKTVHLKSSTKNNYIKHLQKRWGNILEIWEGFAANNDVRYKGSSGGISTALALFCLENYRIGKVIHIGSDEFIAWKNQTYVSKSKENLVNRTGSRYAPASPCTGFKEIHSSQERCAFIGKPCDVASLRKAQLRDRKLVLNTEIAIGFFCAGTPSTRGTFDFLEKHGIHPKDVSELRYRGNGWPGRATVKKYNDETNPLSFSYEESWGFLQKYRPFRCYLCPDLTAEFADISVGDPWYREISEDEKGRSLILIRTEKGSSIFHSAIQAGYIIAEKAQPDILFQSQKNLLGKRQAIWGRILSMKVMRIPYPELNGFCLFSNWLDLPLKGKIKSIVGTLRRIISRNYFKPLSLEIMSKDIHH